MRIASILAVALAFTFGTIAQPIAVPDPATTLAIRDASPAGGWTGLIPMAYRAGKKLFAKKKPAAAQPAATTPVAATPVAAKPAGQVADDLDDLPPLRGQQITEGPLGLPVIPRIKWEPALGKIPEKRTVREWVD